MSHFHIWSDRVFYLRLCFISAILFGPFNVRATEPTLARLSFFVKPDSLSAFDGVYQNKISPIMSSYGLKERAVPYRFKTEGVFSRVFEVKNPSHVQIISKDLNKNKMWQNLLLELGKTFGSQSLQPGQIHSTFQVFTSPATQGKPLSKNIAIPKVMGLGTAHWKNYDETDGLVSGSITAILQDNAGYLWFCTGANGIVRFNGKTWQKIDAEDGLGNDRIRTAIKDVEGKLWFGTASGIGCFNPDATQGQKAWTTYTDILPSKYVWSVYQDRDNNLWFGLNGAIACFDGHTWQFITVDDGLAQDRYMAIHQDAEGNLWFGSQQHGVYRYKDHTLENITEGLPHVFVNTILEDKKGNLWFGTPSGICRYNGESFTTFTTEQGLSSNRVISVGQYLLDKNDHLWFPTDNGVSRFDGKKWHALTPGNGFPLQEVRSIFQDSEGQIWFGGNIGGAVCYNNALTTFTKEDGLVGNHSRVIFQDKSGTLWFGDHNNGVAQWDGKTITQYTKQNGFPSNVVSMHQTKDNTLWFGTSGGGILRYDGKVFDQFTQKHGLLHNIIYDIIQDNNEDLYFILNGGISRYDGQNFTTISRADGFPHRWPYKSIMDHKGQLWFGSYHGGTTRFDGRAFSTYTIQDGLSDNLILSIAQDRNKNIWFGTAKGMSKFDGETWQNFSTDDGLGGTSVEVIYQDRNGHLWMGTRGGGITRFDGEVFQTLTTRDGLASNIVNDIAEDRNGHLWFSTTKGATRYIQPEPIPPSIAITEVVADQRYTDISTLSVSAVVDVVRIEFDGINLKTRPEAMVYRYRLKGHIDAWTNTRDRQVRYENLPIGDYTFEVQSIDRDLVYSQTTASLHVTIHPNYERLVLYGSLGIAVLFLFLQGIRITRQHRTLRQTNVQLQHEIDLRAKLDDQLRNLQYLDQLRSALSTARTPSEIVQKAQNVVDQIGSIQGHIDLNGQTTPSKTVREPSPNTYTRPLVYNNQTHGHLSIYSEIALSESQERALLDETAGQLISTLEARELELQVLQSARLASMGQMAAGVAHELNQPLSAISTTAGDIFECQKEGILLPPNRIQEMMQGLLLVAARMKTTIDHLRTFSRDTSDEPDTLFQMNDCVYNSLTLIQAQLEKHDIELLLDLAKNLPSLTGHSQQLEQVIINLLANARDAFHDISDRKKQIVVRSLCCEQNVQIEIRDNGMGIDDKTRQHIFEPFFTTKDTDKGTGLGLSISYAIVRNHNGTITCQSQKGEGTTFRVELPVA